MAISSLGGLIGAPESPTNPLAGVGGKTPIGGGGGGGGGAYQGLGQVQQGAGAIGQALGQIGSALGGGGGGGGVFDPKINSMKKGGAVKKYTNNGQINLGSCKVSTHQKSKKSPNW
jgi:hypothetical protein